MRVLVLSALCLAMLLNAGCGASAAPTLAVPPTDAIPSATATAALPTTAPQSSAGPSTGNATAAPTGNSTPRAGVTLAPRQPTAVQSASGELNATFQRSGGFIGRNEIFSLKSDGSVDDGKVVLHAAGGAAAAATLAAQLAATGIYTVKPGHYVGTSTCCDRYEYDLTLVQNGQSYNFVTLDGEPSAPPPLLQAIRLISDYIDAAN